MSDKVSVLNSIVGKIEIFGLFLSQCFEFPLTIKLVLCIVLFVSSIFVDVPYCQSEDPFTAVKELVGKNGADKETVAESLVDGSSKLLCLEYKALAGNKKTPLTYEIGIFCAMFFLTRNKIELLLFSLCNLAQFDWMIFFVGVGIVLEWRWEVLALFCRLDEGPNVPFRLLTGYVIYTIFTLINKI